MKRKTLYATCTMVLALIALLVLPEVLQARFKRFDPWLHYEEVRTCEDSLEFGVALTADPYNTYYEDLWGDLFWDHVRIKATVKSGEATLASMTPEVGRLADPPTIKVQDGQDTTFYFAKTDFKACEGSVVSEEDCEIVVSGEPPRNGNFVIRWDQDLAPGSDLALVLEPVDPPPEETPWQSASLPFKVQQCKSKVFLPLVLRDYAAPDHVPGWYEVGAGSAGGGGISNNAGDSLWASLAHTPNGTPYLAWFDRSGGTHAIYVRRWNGSTWEGVGTGPASRGDIGNRSGTTDWLLSLSIAPDGTPYLAWQDDTSGDYEIYVRRWNGTFWEEVGTGSASGGGISNDGRPSLRPSLAIAPDGAPYVAWWHRASDDWEVYVRRWNGSSWAEVSSGSASSGGISNNSGHSHTPSMAIAPNGTPYVAWQDDSSGDYEIYVRRWNGSYWEEMGGSGTGGGVSNNAGQSYKASLALSPDGTPYVAWHDTSSGNEEIYVRRWNGSAWTEVGAGSAGGGGVSRSSGSSWQASLAVTPSGMPYVAWADQSGGDVEIYVRRWNGSAWTEVGAGSAGGGGISDNNGDSLAPSLSIAPDDTPYVAWHDESGGDWEIYALRWEE